MADDSTNYERDESKHIFILSSSGKPIFSRYGDEQELVSTFGLLQAIISIAQDQGDALHCIKAGARRIIYFIRHSLYFIAISSTGEPEVVLTKQLEFMYNQVLFTLTSKVHAVLSQNSSKDLRDLLGSDTKRLMHAACSTDLTPNCIAFESLMGYVMDKSVREDVLAVLKNCVEVSGAALGLILYGDALVAYSSNKTMDLNLHVSDAVLLAHFVGNSSSLRSNDQHWVPLCLPHFNAGAFLQAYISNLRIINNSSSGSSSADEVAHMDLSLVLISAVSDASMFKDLHAGREILEQALTNPLLAPRILASLHDQSRALNKYLSASRSLHFFYKLRPASSVPTQCISTPMEFPLNNSESQDKIVLHYQRLAVCLRKGTSLAEHTLLPSSSSGERGAGGSNVVANINVLSSLPTSDHALAYTVLDCGHVIVGLATSDSELYCTFPGTCSALDACGMANILTRNLKTEAAQILFQS
jgi:hypothetical protein